MNEIEWEDDEKTTNRIEKKLQRQKLSLNTYFFLLKNGDECFVLIEISKFKVRIASFVVYVLLTKQMLGF